jgi:hypothetical protein
MTTVAEHQRYEIKRTADRFCIQYCCDADKTIVVSFPCVNIYQRDSHMNITNINNLYIGRKSYKTVSLVTALYVPM